MSVRSAENDVTTRGAFSASAHLRRLLTGPGPYRQAWLRHCERRREGLNQAAVAAVLSQHLWESGRVSDRDTLLPRRLKDRVSRSLSGRVLSPSMLRLFIEAFEMEESDSQELWSLLLDGGSDIPVVAPTTPMTGRPRAPRPGGYRTLAVHDFHRVGADRHPSEHRTVHVIRATDRVETFQFRFDTDAAAVQVLRGGRAAELTPSGTQGLHAVDITLTQPLRPGETASLEYRTVFAYREPPEPLMRRVVRDAATNVQIHVTFDPLAVPDRVEWCRWSAERLDSAPICAEPVRPNRAGEVHRFLDTVSGTGVGFRWRWDGEPPASQRFLSPARDG